MTVIYKTPNNPKNTNKSMNLSCNRKKEVTAEWLDHETNAKCIKTECPVVFYS